MAEIRKKAAESNVAPRKAFCDLTNAVQNDGNIVTTTQNAFKMQLYRSKSELSQLQGGACQSK